MVVGGSNGIGLALVKQLISLDYHVLICDLCAPDASLAAYEDKYTYYPCNLLFFDEPLFRAFADDSEISCLFLTAGIGRVADFDDLHIAEIERVLRVNAIASLKIVRVFYDRIKSRTPFFCGLMGSIAGLVSSPMFSVYAASKAAVCRFTESINIELEAAGVSNRILNVSPGSVRGTRFNGGPNDAALTAPLAREIISHLFAGKTLYIPEYEGIFRDVIGRYRVDAHAFGLASYAYKKASGRVSGTKREIIGYLSGTFDLFHIGHLNLLRRARQQCDYLIVGVHPDASHKGKETFIPFNERMAIVGACRYVDRVVHSCPEDSDAWEKWHYDKLLVGSDYKGSERFARYEEFFRDKDVQIIYLPYTKGTNSTQIRKTIMSKTTDIPPEK